MPDIIEIGRYSSEFEAQLALAYLESEGISGSMVTDAGGGALPNLTMLTGGVRLLVRSEDAEAARTALSAHSDDEPGSGD